MAQFIIDTQLPPKLAGFLRQKGFDAIHTTHFKEGHLLKDKEIIEISIRESRIIITKDKDFLDQYILKGAPPKVLLLETGNMSNRDLFALMDEMLEQIVDLFEMNHNLVILQINNIIAY
jgi:predicted nuclease of predicted toxin-antitoxin system